MQVSEERFRRACRAAAVSEFESDEKWEGYVRSVGAALGVLGVHRVEETEPTIVQVAHAIMDEVDAALSEIVEGEGLDAAASERVALNLSRIMEFLGVSR